MSSLHTETSSACRAATRDAALRPRRSALFMPGSNLRALEKSRTLPADMLIFDLEDAVAPDRKAAAREAVAAAVAAGGYGSRELLVRVNGLDTPWGRDDLAAVAAMPVHGAVLPKVEAAETVRQAEQLTAAAPELAIWSMIETPLGVLDARAIAAASPRHAGLLMGTSDLAKDLHAHHVPGRLPLLTSLSLCILAARAHGLAILDGVHLDLSDDAGFEAVCRQGAELGFDGKTLIHPKTLAVANAVFAPSAEAVAWSRRITAAFAEAEAAGKGVVLVDGQLIENLHVENARRLVALADRIEALDAAAAAS
jgi:citrate lyase subunit beta/citryl-CoA lyase